MNTLALQAPSWGLKTDVLLSLCTQAARSHCLRMSVFRLGDHVWLNPTSANKTSIAIGGIVKEMKPGKILVEDDEGKEHWIQAEDLGTLTLMHPNSAQGVDDMIHLGDLNEAGMVHNLLIRYQQHKIYVSSWVLVGLLTGARSTYADLLPGEGHCECRCGATTPGSVPVP